MIERVINKPRYVPTAEDRIWRLRRLGYYLAHLLLFALLTNGVGPNLVMFHSLSSPPPEYYVALTPPFVPVIAAIKAYQREKGALPYYTGEIPKEFQPTNYTERYGAILGTSSVTFEVEHHTAVLEYEFTPEKEGWTIYAPRFQGRLDAPLVSPALFPTNTQRNPTPNATQ